ncbi:MAG: Ig-like domain-containing protein [Nocardioides sp.]
MTPSVTGSPHRPRSRRRLTALAATAAAAAAALLVSMAQLPAAFADDPPANTLTMTLSASSVEQGDSVTVTLTGAGGGPSWDTDADATVTIDGDSSDTVTVTMSGNTGTGTIDTTDLSVGDHTLVATFNDATSDSATLTVTESSASQSANVTCDDGDSLTGGVLTVASGETCAVSADTTMKTLVITDDTSAITVPDGDVLSIVVDGVETGQAYDGGSVVAPALVPGTYTSSSSTGVELVLTTEFDYTLFGSTFPLRQALMIDSSGVDSDESVTQAISSGTYDSSEADDLNIASTGEGMAGIDVESGDYDINDPTISFDGNGRLDFAGIGAGIRAANSGTSIRVDGADIDNTGAVRSGVVITDGAEAVIKNSTIATHDGTLPSDYTLSPPPNMRAVPWALGLTGNVRATNMVGSGTKATYLNDDVSSQNWGVLSTDSTSNSYLTSIDTTATTIDGGYGSYADGSSVTDTFLGTTFDVGDYGVISTGGTINIGDASQSAVSALNTADDLGLTSDDIADVTDKATTIDSGRFGIMWHGGGSTNIAAGTVTIGGATKIDTGETTFQDKASGMTLNLDGSDGASVTSGTGVIFQLMESDDPGGLSTTSVYTDPVYGNADAVATRDTDWDLTDTSSDNKPAVINLTDMSTTGDYYNAAYDTVPKNMVLNLDGSTVTGLITSSTSVHNVGTISYDDGEGYKNIGEVTNTATTPVNNGVIVDLTDGSTWKVTGTSYLTSLTLDGTSSIVGKGGRSVTITQGDNTYTPAELAASGTTLTGGYGDPIVVSLSGNATSTTSVKVANTTYGNAGTAKVSVVDGDGDAVSGKVTVKVDGKAAGTATLTNGAASIKLPATTAAGKHTVTATYAGDTTDAVASSSASTTYTVAKASSKASLALSTHKIKASKRVKATIKITSSATPTGIVRVVRGSKVIAKYTLNAAAKGKVTKLLPKLRKGTYKLRVIYTGTTNIRSSTSSTVKLKVTKR